MNRKYQKIMGIVLIIIITVSAVASCTPPTDGNVVMDVTANPSYTPNEAEGTQSPLLPTTQIIEQSTAPTTEVSTSTATEQPTIVTETATVVPTPEQTTMITASPTPSRTMSPLTDITPFITTDLLGNEYSEALFFDAKLTMLNIWATWCQPCIGEIPDIQDISTNFSEMGLQVIGVLYDSTEAGKIDEALAILQNAEITYPTLCNSPTLKESIIDSYSVTAFPTTLFIDDAGNVLRVETGSHSYNEWAGIVNDLLA